MNLRRHIFYTFFEMVTLYLSQGEITNEHTFFWFCKEEAENRLERKVKKKNACSMCLMSLHLTCAQIPNEKPHFDSHLT